MIFCTSNGYTVSVDDEDYPIVQRHSWHATFNGYTHYAIATKRINGHKTTLRLHRLIMNTPVGMECDHIDHNGLNNVKSNLRNCTPSQNCANQRKSRKSTSGFKGVFKHGDSGKWLVQIIHKRKKIHIGYFADINEAKTAYEEKSKEINKEFSCT